MGGRVDSNEFVVSVEDANEVEGVMGIYWGGGDNLGGGVESGLEGELLTWSSFEKSVTVEAGKSDVEGVLMGAETVEGSVVLEFGWLCSKARGWRQQEKTDGLE